MSSEQKDPNSKKGLMFEKANPKSHITSIIGVVSGKGGVGKSTVTCLLASELKKSGYAVGVIDADITGPSIPKGFGLRDRLTANEDGWFPVESKSGIKIVSTNLILEHETDPVLWRGPLISKMVKQFYTDVVWGELDFLLVDFPPGTGDVAITMFQSIPLTGIVVVTSPQDLVSMIVEKAINMANKMEVPVLGLVENMSYFACPNCKTKYNIFGESKIEEISKNLNITLLAKLPIDPEVASLFDQGKIEDAVSDNIRLAALNLVNKTVSHNN
ncbi:MAG: Mrp/NBP35 family ATP-binding protein [Candidatus Izemoplasmatales bacterium]